nr:sigma-70 family RNA polymerase sigma factor [Myxococcus sp. MH1]
MGISAEFSATFERARSRLRAVAFRMLGTAEEADDAVQECWLRASRVDTHAIANPDGWWTTVLSRVCLEMLRARQHRGETPADTELLEESFAQGETPSLEDEAVRAESVGLALLVVLETLGPAERIAFVLHDLFSLPFEDIATIVERSPVAAKKLASRARHRVRGRPLGSPAELDHHRQVIEAFLAASRAGDLDALLAVLAPDVVRRADAGALRPATPAEVRGARRVAEETLTNTGRARFARVALIDGKPGIVVAPRGRLRLVLEVDIARDRVAAFNVISEHAHLRRLHITLLAPGS